MAQIATALFANSPFTEEKPNGFLSMRRFLQFELCKKKKQHASSVKIYSCIFVSAIYGQILTRTELACFPLFLMSHLGIHFVPQYGISILSFKISQRTYQFI